MARMPETYPGDIGSNPISAILSFFSKNGGSCLTVGKTALCGGGKVRRKELRQIYAFSVYFVV